MLKVNVYPACSLEENTKFSGHNLYTTKGIKVGNMAGCAPLCLEDSKCKFWTYNPTFKRFLASLLFVSQRLQVLDEDFGPGKESIYKGINFRAEGMWGIR